MKEFDLNKAVEGWKKELNKQQGLEPGYIEELESHLLDRIDEYLEEGYSKEEAFKVAVEKSMSTPKDLANEFYNARSKNDGRPPWERKPSLLSRMPMHFKTAIRNLNKRRVHAVLNVTGLAVSICIGFLIWFYINDQSSYDQHFENADRIYRVIYDVTYGDNLNQQADAGQPVGPTLKADFPEVMEFTRTRRIGGTNTLAKGDISIESPDFFVTDENFFKVFSHELIGGNQETALTEPNTVVITEDLALRLLGRTDVVGETLIYSGLRPPMDIKISGVIKNPDPHTHLPFQALISYSTYFDQKELINWMRKSFTYILLNEQNDIESVRAKIPEFNDKYLKEVFARRADAIANLLFQPLTEIYLADEYLGEPYPHGNKSNLEILTVVMLFLLVMAVINYINLATAQAVDRAAEVGIRKTLGSTRKSLMTQFLSEAILLSLVAGILAIVISLPIIPYYKQLTNMDINYGLLLEGENLLRIVVLSIGIGILAGIYPSFYLTSFRPQSVLKGKFSTSKKGVVLRKGLIIAQYSISSILIIWMVVIGQQIHFMKTKEVGFDRNGIIELKVPDDRSALKNVDAFIQEVNRLPDIRSSAKTTSDLSNYYGEGFQLMENPDGSRVTAALGILSVGYDFVETVGAYFVVGRDFDRTIENERSVLINQAAVEAYGWEGRELEVNFLGRDRQGNVSGRWKVVGVVSNFRFGKSYEEPGPIIFYLDNRTIPESNLLIGIERRDPLEVVPVIASIWDNHFAAHPFEFKLLSDKLDALYWREQTFLDLLIVLGGIIVFITILGIVGMISFSTATRKKEIALRKICGAKVRAILFLLSRQFATLLIVSTLIAVPIGFYITEAWLADYSLHIPLGIWPFIIAIPVSLVFTILALSYHSLKAARTNPVEAIRYE